MRLVPHSSIVESHIMNHTQNIEEKISAWLKNQGYPLEMQVASTLQDLNFRVIQSEYYKDPESGDFRELDVVGFMQREVGDVVLRISFMIECKCSVDKPWLLFTSRNTRLSNRARIAQRAANTIGQGFLWEIVDQIEIQNSPLFSIPERPAYGVTQAFTSGKDICYSAVTGVSKAAQAEIRELDKKKTDLVDFLAADICSIIFPVVVVDARLFEVFLAGESEPNVGEIENGVLLWRNQFVGNPHTIVNIVKVEAFKEFAHMAAQSIKAIFDLPSDVLSAAITEAVKNADQSSD